MTNGACGEILAIETSKDSANKVETIFVKFDQIDAGKQVRSENPRLLKQYGDNATPIKRISFEYSLGKSARQHSAKAKFIQFPLKLAWAITAHKVQGQTVKHPKSVGLDLQSTFACAQTYVMLGRTENLNQIYLAKFDDSKFKVDKSLEKSLKENKNLEKRAKKVLESDNWLTLSDTFRLSSLNIRSLQSHFTDLEVDHCLLNSDVIAVSETWCSTEPPKLKGYNGFHALAGRGEGISLFIKNNHKLTSIPKIYNEQHIQIISASLEKVAIVLVYRSPAYHSQELLIKELISILPKEGPAIICGDFNIHPNEKNSYFSRLSEKMKSQNFAQHIDKPTHRGGHILDHLYVREVNMIGWQFHHPYYSDHEAICCMAKL